MRVLFLATLLQAQAAVTAPHPPANWDIPTFERMVQPMRHATAGRLPLFVWWLPTPQGDGLLISRANGSLRRWVDALAIRGTVATVQVGGLPVEDSLALARTLQEAGQPVYFVFPKQDVLESTVWKDCKVWAAGKEFDLRTPHSYPCLPLADGKIGARWMKEQLLPFRAAGIRVSGVWFDDERLPYPWVPVWQAQRDSADCRRYYPPGVLDDLEKFRQYVLALRSKLISQVMADPVHQLFPGAIVGNFGEVNSGAEVPYEDTYGLKFPAGDVGTADAMMPGYYGLSVHQPATRPGQALTQQVVDRQYLQQMLTSATTAAANARGKLHIPYVSPLPSSDLPPDKTIGISREAYRELLRHIWLRGASCMFLFGLAYPDWHADQTASLNSIEDARSVYDELLAFRPFLDKGTPMNLTRPDFDGKAPLWSGLRLAGQCLVRTFSLDGQATTVTITPSPGWRLKLKAPPQGATYLIHRDGRVEQVG